MSRSRGQPGFALIAVLWVVVIAGMILLGVQKGARVILATAHNELAAVQAHWLARAGVEQAMAVLEEDDPAVDSSYDWWYDDPDSFQQVQLTGGEFSVTATPLDGNDADVVRFGLFDHSARLNVNTADEKQLTALDIIDDTQAAAILDWRDTDDSTKPGGAERAHYDEQPFPYDIRNGPMRTIQELRLIRHMEDAAFYGEDANLNGLLDANENDQDASWPGDDGDGQLQRGLAGLATVYSYEANEDAYGNSRTNLNTATKQDLKNDFSFSDTLADAVVKQRNKEKFKKVTDLLDVKVDKKSGSNSTTTEEVTEISATWLANNFDLLTTTDDERLPGKINVNTAPRQVLLALPEMTEDAADEIAARQSSAEGPFEGVGELFTAKTLSEKQFKAIADLVTVRSTVFEIHSTATTVWGIRASLVAVVDRGASPMRILYWYQDE